MDPTKRTVRHHDNQITGFGTASDLINNRLNRRAKLCVNPTLLQAKDQILR